MKKRQEAITKNNKIKKKYRTQLKNLWQQKRPNRHLKHRSSASSFEILDEETQYDYDRVYDNLCF